MEKLSRREFVRVSALATAATVAAACAQPTATPEAAATTAPTATTAASGGEATAVPTEVTAVSRFNEAPMLAEKVAAGALPPVEDRIPENPAVLPVAESIGQYGGTWRCGFKGVSDVTGQTYMNWNSLTRFNPDLTITAMLAESWDMSDDATTWTWHLRAGTCWSDGTPLTTEDVQWWYDNYAMNTVLNPSGISAFKTGSGDDSQMCALEVVDDFTFILTFAHPNPLFGYLVIWREFPMMPGYYLEQYHADFADATALAAMVADGQYADWAALFTEKRQEHLNPEVPRLDVWLYTNEAANELVITERNAYCWMVDEEGNQLPYVDYINYRLFETIDVFNMWVVNGEIDMQARHIDSANFTLFKENEDAGGYDVLLALSASIIAVQPNLTCKQPELRTFFNVRDVRFALNFAVNRDEMNELIYDGLQVPMQYSPLSVDPLAYPEQAYANLEYDPDKANDLLDAAGYSEKSADGYRLFPETGEIISFEMEGLEPSGSPYEDAMILVSQYWQAIGIKAVYKYSERSLYEEHQQANEMLCGTWSADRTVMTLLAPDNIFIGNNTQRPWADAWGQWYNDPTQPNAEEPPADHWIRTIWDLWDQIKVEGDEATRTSMFHQILDVWKEEMPMQGYLGEAPYPVIKNKHMHNYVGGYPEGWLTHGISVLNCPTFYYDDPENH